MSATDAIAELDRRFGIPDTARVVAGNGGLAKVRVTAAAATGEVYLHGAHVTSWQPRGADEVLFISSRSHWEDGRPIRGGVPVCFPWFANKADDPTAPMHGFVRTKAWRLESITPTGDAVTVSMATESDDATKRWWPANFHLSHRVTFGPELSLDLTLTNTGTAPLRFEEALHTYLRVGRIEETRLRGLEGTEYVDKTDSYRKKTQEGPVTITAETDRVYLDTAATVEVEDDALRRRLRVAKEKSLTTVVWNPWVGKAKALPDFADDEWPHMLCVETCNLADFAVHLEPGRQHRMRAILRVDHQSLLPTDRGNG